MAVLKQNGTPGQFEMTLIAKIVSAFLTAVVAAGAAGSVASVLTTRDLVIEVQHLKNDVSRLIVQRDNLSERLAVLEGRHQEIDK